MVLPLQAYQLLQTERLLLRKPSLDDAPVLNSLRNNEAVNRYIGRKPSVVSETAAFIAELNQNMRQGNAYYWIICLKETQAILGTICLWNFNADNSIADVGYELSPEYQGKGYMNEALAPVLKFGFDMLRLDTIIGVTHRDNAPSQALLKRSGFKLDMGNEFLTAEESGDNVAYFMNSPNTLA